MNQPTSADSTESAQPLMGPLALFCWLTSLFMPIMSAPQGWLLGGEFVVKGLIAFPMAIFFSPVLALAPFTNIIFLANLSRLWSLSASKSPNVVWVGGALVFNCFAILVGSANERSILGDIGRYPAMWLWLMSFALLCMAITQSEKPQAKAPNGILNNRWKLAIALSCVLSIAGLAVRTIKFPAPMVSRTEVNVESIEVRRSGVPPRRYPLLEDGYLRQSKYKIFVLDGKTHESLRGGGWIVRPDAGPVRHVVNEVVESYRLGPEGPGEVLRSTVTIYDGEELIARKTFYDGMIEDGHGWVGNHVLKFVQSVLQPAPSRASIGNQRLEVFVHPLELPSDFKLGQIKRNLQNCPSSVALNPNDWRELRTSKWSLQTLLNITDVACSEDSVLVVMGRESEVFVDVIGLDGRVISQSRATVRHKTDQYEMEEARAGKDGWQIRLVAFRPGPSTDVPTVPLERFEISLEPNKLN